MRYAGRSNACVRPRSSSRTRRERDRARRRGAPGCCERRQREEARRLAGKVARLRIFENEDGRFDRSLLDVHGEALVVSDPRSSRTRARGIDRASRDAADPAEAEPLYEVFCSALADGGVPVSRGVFGTRMEVTGLANDGPQWRSSSRSSSRAVAILEDVPARVRPPRSSTRTTRWRRRPGTGSSPSRSSSCTTSIATRLPLFCGTRVGRRAGIMLSEHLWRRGAR